MKSNYYIFKFTGTMGHNSKHGCTRCTTVGEWSYVSNTTVFPKLDAAKRTDHDFRNNVYFGSHQRELTPLLRLKTLDMIQDFPIGDCLHLLDHGITSKILNGLIQGKLTNIDAKWSDSQMKLVSRYLSSIKPPAEIRAQRPIRNLDTIGKWKAIEYRNFGLYLGMIVLKNNVKDYIFKHLLLYFCALNIISSKHHLKRLFPVAEWCIKLFVERFKVIFGSHHFSSNVHNLIHLMDDIKRFGPVNTFSTYPFEGLLFKIRRLLRSGNLPLIQVARRIIEMDSTNSVENESINPLSFSLGKPLSIRVSDLDKILPMKYELYSRIIFAKFELISGRDEDCWVLTKNADIFNVLYIVSYDGQYFLYGQTIEDTNDYFTLPFKSSEMFIYSSLNLRKSDFKLVNIVQIQCKMFKIKREEQYVFYKKVTENENENLNEFVFLPLLGTIVD